MSDDRTYTEPSSSQPLLSSNGNYNYNYNTETWHERHTRYYRAYSSAKGEVKRFLSSRAQHWTVLSLVSFDLLGIFADIIINLYQCDEKDSSAVWNDVREGLGVAGLVFSCLFMLELVLSVWAFGWRYFQSWFHTFDALVILAGFVVDVLLHGVLEEVASLVVILRLWRFFKIIEEFSVGAEEQMDGLQLRIEQLETENQDLKAQLKKSKAVTEGEDDDVEQGLGKGKGTDGSGSGLWSQ